MKKEQDPTYITSLGMAEEYIDITNNYQEERESVSGEKVDKGIEELLRNNKYNIDRSV